MRQLREAEQYARGHSAQEWLFAGIQSGLSDFRLSSSHSARSLGKNLLCVSFSYAQGTSIAFLWYHVNHPSPAEHRRGSWQGGWGELTLPSRGGDMCLQGPEEEEGAGRSRDPGI